MSEPLTKRQALEMTRDLWLWLASHPDKRKHHWPGWENCRELLPWASPHHCPCCEYVARKTGERYVNGDASECPACLKCPLLSLWPKGCEPYRESDDSGDVQVPTTPWETWAESTWRGGSSDSSAAMQIAQAAQRELDKLENNACASLT